ncbi:MAG: hypothetical protein K2L88_06515, partial [Clostridiales bacterium]|nr:hypothetical protein [Clostridiales bacterium]
PELYLGKFVEKGKSVLEGDEVRKQKVLDYLVDGSYKKVIDCPIIDFDFSSCEHLTSIYDDPIGFTSHEIAFTAMPSEKELVWIAGESVNKKDIAISYIIRYLRFGGRKIMYHIFHPNAYKYRFKYDNENFYFDNLIEIILHYWPQAKDVIPEFIKFITSVKEFDKSKIIDSIDEFELQYPQCNRKFYVDVFPY